MSNTHLYFPVTQALCVCCIYTFFPVHVCAVQLYFMKVIIFKNGDLDFGATGNSFFSLIEIMVLNYGASIIMVDT